MLAPRRNDLTEAAIGLVPEIARGAGAARAACRGLAGADERQRRHLLCAVRRSSRRRRGARALLAAAEPRWWCAAGGFVSGASLAE